MNLTSRRVVQRLGPELQSVHMGLLACAAATSGCAHEVLGSARCGETAGQTHLAFMFGAGTTRPGRPVVSSAAAFEYRAIRTGSVSLRLREQLGP
jgi:hypothetical protein